MFRLMCVSVTLIFSQLSFSAVCHSTPEAVLEDPGMKRAHALLKSQEYVGNIGQTLAAKKDHDTYFNWESRRGFFGRIYSAKFNRALTGRFKLCRSSNSFQLVMNDGTRLPIRIARNRVHFKYTGMNFSFAPYPLDRHGTLRYKLKNSEIGSQVRRPKKWRRGQN